VDEFLVVQEIIFLIQLIRFYASVLMWWVHLWRGEWLQINCSTSWATRATNGL